MYKCLNALALGTRGTLSEQVELALWGGFGGLDVNMAEVAAIMAERGVSYGQTIFRSAKLNIGSWQLSGGWQDDEESCQRELKRLAQWAELSQQLGGSRVVTVIQPASEERPFHENFEWHRQRLAPVADVLKKFECSLGLEFIGPASPREGKRHEFIHTLEAASQLAEAIGTGNVGIVLDAFHWFASGGSLDAIRNLKPSQIVAVHVSDAPAGVAREELKVTVRTLPGQTGVIPIVEFLKALKEIGYAGPVTPEVSRDQLRSHHREQTVRAANEALKQLWEQAGIGAAV